MHAVLHATWKGFLRVGSVSCGMKIVGVVTEAEKIRFNAAEAQAEWLSGPACCHEIRKIRPFKHKPAFMFVEDR
jgi:hypothetical protein